MVDHCLRLLRVVISDENTCYYDVAVIEGNRVLGWACVTRRRAGATTIDNLQIFFPVRVVRGPLLISHSDVDRELSRVTTPTWLP